MKKYVNYNAIAELERESLTQLIKNKLEAAQKVATEERDQQLIEKLQKLAKLSDVADLDLPFKKTRVLNVVPEKYFAEIKRLISQGLFEEARLLAILEIKGLDAYLNSQKKFKYIWPQYLANNRCRKTGTSKQWINEFTAFRDLITNNVITLEQCLKYPFAFTVLIRLRTEVNWSYKTVFESKYLTIRQRRDIINFLWSQDIKPEVSVDEIYKIWIRSGSNMYRDLLPVSHGDKLTPENGFDFVFEAAKSKKSSVIKALKSCPRVFEPNEKGVYPIEYIMARSKSRKDWYNQFAKWHHEDKHWKRDNLRLLQRRLRHSKLDANSAFFFYVTMGLQNDDTKLFHSLKTGFTSSHELRQLHNSDPDPNNANCQFPLSELPIDIIHVISKHLSLTSVMALTLTCKRINQMINVNGDSFWKMSLAITCPRSKFETTNSNWKETAVREVKTRHHWVTGKTVSYQPSINYKDCFLFDENWGLFHQWDNHNSIHRALFDCHSKRFLPVPDVGVPTRYFSHSFLNSKPNTLPTIVYVVDSNIYYQRDRQKIVQTAPCLLYNGMGLGSDKLFFNDFIWDVEKGTQLMTFDLHTTHQFMPCGKRYDEKSNTLMLAKDEQFFTIDLRSGQLTSHDLPAAGQFDLIDDHVIGYVSYNTIGSYDLRMNRKDVLHSDPIYTNHFKVLVSGKAQKALIYRGDGLVVQWDFRERAWDRVFYQNGYLHGINSRQLVSYRDNVMYVEDFSA